MSFLDKFQGRTNILSQQQAKHLLGDTKTHQQNNHPIPNPKGATISHTQNRNKGKNPKQTQQQSKQNKVSPFLILNPFYLDQLQRERDQRAKRQQQIRQRVEREKKKQMQLEAKLAQSSKINRDKFSTKEWITMGGLGPNIGTQDWTKKTQLHNKMLVTHELFKKFSKQIQKVNFQKIKCIPFVSLSHLHHNQKQNPRSRAIQYSHSVPRPKIIAGEHTLERLPRSQSKEEFTQLQQLNNNHIKYVQMMKKL